MTYEEKKPRPWSSRERGLISWYRKARLQNRFPSESFRLGPMATIMVPERFYDMLDFEAGHDQAETVRALRNSFAYDLERLHACVEGKEFADAGTVPNLFEDGPEGYTEAGVSPEVRKVPVLFE
jgi:hypothetical protein